ncbi:MAG: hypothetical protein AAFO07_04245 [Bacteroidota bacterium]
MELSGISKYIGANIGGLKSIQYVPINWIDQSTLIELISDSNNFLYSIPLLPEKTWLNIPYLPTGDEWLESTQPTTQGEVYPQAVSFFVPSLRPDVTAEFARMNKMKFLIQLTDKNQLTWLIGDPRIGLNFSYAGTSGATRGNNNYALSFSGSMKRPACQYSPTLS